MVMIEFLLNRIDKINKKMPKSLLTLVILFCFTLKMWSQPPTQEELENRKAKIQLEILAKEQQ